MTAELKFTPNSESGTVSINLGEFDATSLDGHTLVVFEELTKQSDIDGKATDVTVAEHKDINDEGQSVTVTSTPAGSTYGKTGVDHDEHRHRHRHPPDCRRLRDRLTASRAARPPRAMRTRAQRITPKPSARNA